MLAVFLTLPLGCGGPEGGAVPPPSPPVATAEPGATPPSPPQPTGPAACSREVPKQVDAAGVPQPTAPADAPRSDKAAICEPPLGDIAARITEDATSPFDGPLREFGRQGKRPLTAEEYRQLAAKQIRQRGTSLCRNSDRRGDDLLQLGIHLESLAYYSPGQRLPLRRRAVAVLRAALERSSQQTQQQIRIVLGKVYAQSKRYDDAERELQQVIADGCFLTAVHSAHAILARIRLSQGLAKKAELQVEDAERSEAERQRLEAAIATRWQEAEQQARAAIEVRRRYKTSGVGPSDFLALPWVLLGHALEEQGRRDEARQAFDRGYKRARRYWQVYDALYPPWARPH